jgi:hypothetical protein
MTDPIAQEGWRGNSMWDELPEDILAELKDERFKGRVHYSRATYAEGCHGPLCRKAETDRSRKRNQRRAEEEGREYVPNLSVRDREREDFLNKVIAWHRWEHEGQKLTERFGGDGETLAAVV